MNETLSCKSCSMTIESGDYCAYCTDDSGHLHPFEETVERFMQWARKREPGLSDADARRQTLEYMSAMPAWAEHPELKSASSEG